MARNKFNSKELRLNSRNADKLNKTTPWVVLYNEDLLNKFGYKSKILRSIYGQSIGMDQLKNIMQPFMFKNKRKTYGK